MKKNTSGYSLVELLLFAVAIVGIVLMSWPAITTLRTNERAALRGKVISKVETAKNQFDAEASDADRKKFDAALNEERFNTLSALIGQKDPIRFLAGSGITTLKINKLGVDVEAD